MSQNFTLLSLGVSLSTLLSTQEASDAFIGRLGDDADLSGFPGHDDPVVAFTKLENIYTEKLQERESELVKLKAASAERELLLHEELRRKDAELTQLKNIMETEVRSRVLFPPAEFYPQSLDNFTRTHMHARAPDRSSPC